MRKHPKFGKLFREEEIKEEAKEEVSDAPDITDDGTKQPEVSFSNNEDAKEYLADRFGVSRSKLRTRQEMEEVAKANNLTINWTA